MLFIGRVNCGIPNSEVESLGVASALAIHGAMVGAALAGGGIGVATRGRVTGQA